MTTPTPSAETNPVRSRIAQAIPAVAILLAVLAAGLVLGRRTQEIDPVRMYTAAAASILFGSLVGLSEILSRYRDEPILASTTSFGLGYLLLNGMISLAAFTVLRLYPKQIFAAVENDLFLTAVIAGFGGMAVFRSKLFTFRSTDGKEYPIGPAIVLETVLKTIDHKIDRRRATERQAKVFGDMRQLKDFDHTAQYIEASLNSFQNLTTEEKAEIVDIIREYRTLTWPAELKIMALGFAFLNIAGEENFDEVVRNVKTFLEDLAAADALPADPPPAPPA